MVLQPFEKLTRAGQIRRMGRLAAQVEEPSYGERSRRRSALELSEIKTLLRAPAF
ncbi:MAG TPA: hypothetical protein VHD63_10175 [Ktedonobacteraceae bacterium]|nr:hypothetical protein [Ktedonobacteraceae bacterium]